VEGMILGDVTEVRIAIMAGVKYGQGRHTAEGDGIELGVPGPETPMMRQICLLHGGSLVASQMYSLFWLTRWIGISLEALCDSEVNRIDRTFVGYVTQSFRDRALRCEVLQMPRVSLAAVVKRQVIEGVQAVVKIFRSSQVTGKIPLQVFNRSSGAENVKFEGETAITQLLKVSAVDK